MYSLNILKFRNLKGYTQKQLANKIGIHQSYLSELERNKKSPTLRVLFKIGQALDMCPHLLVNYEQFCKNDCRHNCKT